MQTMINILPKNTDIFLHGSLICELNCTLLCRITEKKLQWTVTISHNTFKHNNNIEVHK